MTEEQYKESFKCPICNGNKIKKLYDRFPGYVDKTYFDIYKNATNVKLNLLLLLILQRNYITLFIRWIAFQGMIDIKGMQ